MYMSEFCCYVILNVWRRSPAVYPWNPEKLGTRLAESKLKPPFIMSRSAKAISTCWIRETAWELLRRTGHLYGLRHLCTHRVDCKICQRCAAKLKLIYLFTMLLKKRPVPEDFPRQPTILGPDNKETVTKGLTRYIYVCGCVCVCLTAMQFAI